MSECDVSRETLEKLQTYHDLIHKWNPTINLVSRASLAEIWERHIWDSAQIYDVAGNADHWADIGSGGGLPGIVVAILACEKHLGRHVTLIESDRRKATFLRTVIREVGLNASVIVSRIEDVPPLDADVLSARALADLPILLGFADRHVKAGGKSLFFKGQTWEKEVADARESWSFDLLAHKSKTNPQAAILEVKDIRRD
ncbi:16S rRNA (guanine(527)-N(7))-methyltransferase RsmG [Roseobacter insulae]